MEITFLGTSCMVPTKERNVSGLFIDYKGEGILVDCGEGTQRQMNIAGIKRTSVRKVLITHWHGDHVSGLIGLIQTIGNKEEAKNITIFGPKGSKLRVKHMLATCVFDLSIEITVKELNYKKPTKFFENEDYKLEAVNLDHKTPAVGYSFIAKDKLRINKSKLNIPDGPHLTKLLEGKNITYNNKKINYKDVTYEVKGKKISFVWDTYMCKSAIQLAKDADILVCESTYMQEQEEKAKLHKHMTAKDAAMTAQQANAKSLILTHFSQRFKEVGELTKEAQEYFENTQCAFDFMKLKL